MTSATIRRDAVLFWELAERFEDCAGVLHGVLGAHSMRYGNPRTLAGPTIQTRGSPAEGTRHSFSEMKVSHSSTLKMLCAVTVCAQGGQVLGAVIPSETALLDVMDSNIIRGPTH